MKAALWTGVLVVLPGAWFYAQGEVLRWFTDGEPPRVLRPLVDPVPPARPLRLARARRRPLGRPDPAKPMPPVLITLELRRLEQEIRRVEEVTRSHRRLGCVPSSPRTTSSSSSSASGWSC